MAVRYWREVATVYQAETCGEALLQLLRAALWGEKPCECLFTSLSPEYWRQIYDLSRMHTVGALACQGLTCLPDDCLPDDALLARWMAEMSVTECRSRRMNEALAALTDLLARRGLRPWVLKGQSLARLYSTPLLRECGDIDLYFPLPGQNSAALRVLREMGIEVQGMPDGSHTYEWMGFPVEHHPRMTDLSNPLLYGRVREWEKRYPAQKVTLGMGHDTALLVPSPTLLLFLLDAHILKHVLGWGIGLRQLADMAVACRVLHGQVCGEALRGMAATAHVLRWDALLHGVLLQCFHLPVASLPYAGSLHDGRALMNRVWTGGNFGLARREQARTSACMLVRKWRTALALMDNVRFGLTYAPLEMLCMPGALAWGQMHMLRQTHIL